MKVLITSAASRLPSEIGSWLSHNHQVRLTDRKMVAARLEFVRSDLGHDAGTNLLVRGMDVIIHWGESDPQASASEQLDYAMRCTYNLLWAAAEERVPLVILLSSLKVLDRYPEDLAVTERWRPVPTTDAPTLCYHLGEFVCREFARERKLNIICLRLGELVWDATPSAQVSTSALYRDDLLQAVEKALVADVTGWNIFHVQSAVPNARYLTTAAQKSLGFSPSQI